MEKVKRERKSQRVSSASQQGLKKQLTDENVRLKKENTRLKSKLADTEDSVQ